jgi:hypothetical protein
MSILEPYFINNYSPEDADIPEVVKHINDDLLRIMQNEWTNWQRDGYLYRGCRSKFFVDKRVITLSNTNQK